MSFRLLRRPGAVRQACLRFAFLMSALCLPMLAMAQPFETVAYEGHASATTSGESSLFVPAPSGAQIRELLVAHIAFRGGANTATPTPPDGWMLVHRVDSNTQIGHAVFIRALGSAADVPVPGSAYEWQFAANVTASGAISRYSGVNLFDPVIDDNMRSGGSRALMAPGIDMQRPGAVVAFYNNSNSTTINVRKPVRRYNLPQAGQLTIAMGDVQIPQPRGTSNKLGLAGDKADWTTSTIGLGARSLSDADPALSLIDADPQQIVADGAATSLITVLLVDGFGIPLQAGGDIVELETDAGTLLGDVTDHGDGSYSQFLQSSTGIETATVSARVNFEAMAASAMVDFIAGAASATGSTITAGSAQLPADGTSTTTITVQVRDENGNPVTQAGLNVALETTLGSLGESSGTTDANGRFQTMLTAPAAPGTADITGTLEGDSIADSAQVEFIASDVSAAQTTIVAGDPELIADGLSSTTITVQARDGAGDVLTQQGLAVTLLTSLGTLAETSGSTDANGLFQTTLTSATTVGTATVTGTIVGADIGDSAAVEFIAGPVAATGSTISAADNQLAADGIASTTITVQARDAVGNAVAEAGLAVVIGTSLGSLNETSGSTDAQGRFQTTLVSATVAGVAVVSGTLDGNAIGNNALVEFVAGAVDASESTITANPEEVEVNVDSQSTITVQVRDAFGNAVAMQGLAVTLSTDLGVLTATGGTTGPNGRFITTLTAGTETGTATVTGTIAGDAIGHPATVLFFEAAPDPTLSLISASPTVIFADGISTSLITVELRDASDRPLIFGDAEVVLQTTAGTLLGSVVDNGDGTYGQQLQSSTTVETATVTGVLNGEDMLDTASVEFEEFVDVAGDSVFSDRFQTSQH